MTPIRIEVSMLSFLYTLLLQGIIVACHGLLNFPKPNCVNRMINCTRGVLRGLGLVLLHHLHGQGGNGETAEFSFNILKV